MSSSFVQEIQDLQLFVACLECFADLLISDLYHSTSEEISWDDSLALLSIDFDRLHYIIPRNTSAISASDWHFKTDFRKIFTKKYHLEDSRPGTSPYTTEGTPHPLFIGKKQKKRRSAFFSALPCSFLFLSSSFEDIICKLWGLIIYILGKRLRNCQPNQVWDFFNSDIRIWAVK